MGAAALPLIGSGISAGAGLLGAGKAASAQNQDNQAAAGMYSAEEQAIKQLLGNYFQMAPDVEHGLLNFPKTLMHQQQGLIQELGNQMGSANQSLLQSFRGELGGVANPGAVLGGMARGNAQSQAQAVQGMQANMQSMMGGEELGALQDLGSFVTAPLASSLGGLQNMGNTYAGAAASYGNPWESALGGIGNLLSQFGMSSAGAAAPSASIVGPSNDGIIPAIPSIGSQPDYPGFWGQYNTNPYSGVGPQP